MSRDFWPEVPNEKWLEMLRKNVDDRAEIEDFRNQYLCEPQHGSGMTSFQLGRLRPPALYVMVGREIASAGKHFVEDFQLRHIRIVSADVFLAEPSLLRGSLWTDFDVDHAVWEYISTRWSYPREDQFKHQTWIICRMIEDRTKQRASMLEGFGKFYDERAKAAAEI